MVQITLKIDGMACGMCESLVNEAVRAKFPVKKVTATRCWATPVSPMRKRACSAA